VYECNNNNNNNNNNIIILFRQRRNRLANRNIFHMITSCHLIILMLKTHNIINCQAHNIWIFNIGTFIQFHIARKSVSRVELHYNKFNFLSFDRTKVKIQTIQIVIQTRMGNTSRYTTWSNRFLKF